MCDLIFHNPEIKFGCHVGKFPSYVETFNHYAKKFSPIQSYQIYVANSRSYAHPKFDVDDILGGRKILSKNNKFCVIHGALTHNLCGSTELNKDPKFVHKRRSTIEKLNVELDIGVGLDCGVVCHFGTCKFNDKGRAAMAGSIEECLRKETANTVYLAKALNISKKDVMRKRKLVLENSAREGTDLGWNLKEISEIINMVHSDYRDQLLLCIDTAHIFGAGEYHFGKVSETERFYQELEDYNLLDRLHCFHFNDSKSKFDSHVDRHMNLTMGNIWGSDETEDDALRYFIEEAHKHRIPLICEPPAKGHENGASFDFSVASKIYPDMSSTFHC